MFTRLGQLSVRRHRLVLALSAIFLVLAGVLGTGVFSQLSTGGFDDPTSESVRADRVLAEQFHTGAPNLIFLVDVDRRVTASASDVPAVDAADVSAEADRVLRRLRADPAINEAVSYWSLGNVAPLRNREGDAAMIAAHIAGDDDAISEATTRLLDELEGERGPITLSASGRGPVFHAVSTNIESDLTRAEAIAVPITMLLLVLVFGGLVAAGLPLLVGVISVLGTFLTLWLVSQVTDLSIFSINLVTAMGLGLAIDYSLFIVSRFREELRARPQEWWGPEDRRSIDAAIVRTVETAGRTVAFSALTVGVSLSALLVFPLYFLRSFAWAGIGVTLVAAAASVLTLPAFLKVLGRRVDSLRLWGRHREPTPEGQGFWHRVAVTVMKRPVLTSVVVVTFLLFLGAPFLRVSFATPDQRVLPETDHTRQTTDRLATEFASNEAAAFPIVWTTPTGDGPSDGQVDVYASTVSAIDGVSRVDAPTGRYIDGALVLPPDEMLVNYRSGGDARFSVVPSVEPVSEEGEHLVETIRDIEPSTGATSVGGATAQLIDAKSAIAERLPYALAIIVVATFILLFLMFGSVLVPLKAIVLNVLSLSATFGAMVWVFQEGHGSGILNFTATGLTDTTTPILMFCIAFGLSMDYEVFLLSRIKEEYDRTGDNEMAVALGLERTGRIVTAAAALLAVTFLAFATSGITFIKLFGLGLALAVLMDATLIRATLVPAFMKLAGRANWWAPAWMRRIHDRIGFSEHDPGVGPTADETAGADLGPDRDRSDGEGGSSDRPDHEPVPVG